MEEEWKDIVGYIGRYQISNMGRVKSLYRIFKGKGSGSGSGIHRVNERILIENFDKYRYKYCILSKDAVTKTFKVHRLVALSFIPNPEDKPQVNHIDGNKSNNRLDNLEWVTASENITHANRIGLHDSNILKRSKPVNQINHNGLVIRTWKSATDCSRNGYSRECVRDCCLGKQKTHAGHRWEYAVPLFTFATLNSINLTGQRNHIKVDLIDPAI